MKPGAAVDDDEVVAGPCPNANTALVPETGLEPKGLAAAVVLAVLKENGALLAAVVAVVVGLNENVAAAVLVAVAVPNGVAVGDWTPNGLGAATPVVEPKGLCALEDEVPNGDGAAAVVVVG